MLKKHLIVIFCTFFLANCQNPTEKFSEKQPSVPKIFEEEAVLNLELQMDLNKVLTDIGENRLWHEAFLVWNKQKIKIRVRTRGNFRRNPENCNFPPLYWAFDSTAVLNTPFEGLPLIRLVTHCQKNDDLYEQIIIEEYNIYKNYEILTDKSVKTRLCEILYRDLKDETNSQKKVGFLVEGTDFAAKRLQAQIVKKTDTVQYLACNSFLVTQLAVFQFMVGNTDWSVSNQHNLDIFEFSGKNYVPVPYDFDFSGIIDAPYAAPDSLLENESVRQRIYRGYCQSEAELFLVLDKFKKKEKEIKKIWEDLPYQTPERKKKSLDYLQNFYEILQNKDSVRFYFLQNCR